MRKLRVFLLVMFVAGCGAAYYFLAYRPAHIPPHQTAYAMSSVEVQDSRAAIHNIIGTVKKGQRVEVISSDDHWAQLLLPGGEKGWIESDDLMDSAVYQGGQKLLQELQGNPVQASGHTSFDVNLHLDPSREGPLLGRLPRRQELQIFGRRVVPRTSTAAESGDETPAAPQAGSAAPIADAWYLVKAGSRAGWLLGRLVTLDIPDNISAYAQNHNMVAWLVLNTVDDKGRKVPQYLVADRDGTDDYDFNHVRVFTWWPKAGHYATAYVEGRLRGYFPIQVAQAGEIPEFRLRLVDAKGRKIQKIYRLIDTVVRPLGTVDGWTSDAAPVPEAKSSRRRMR